MFLLVKEQARGHWFISSSNLRPGQGNGKETSLTARKKRKSRKANSPGTEISDIVYFNRL